MAKKKENKQPEIIDVKESKTKSNRKENFINYLKDLGLSLVKTKNLFRWGIRHWITPLITFIIITFLIVIPPYLEDISAPGDTIIKNNGILYSDQVISHLLSTDVKCKITQGKLVCDEGYSYTELYTFINKYEKEVKYNIFVNAKEEVDKKDKDKYFQIKDWAEDGDNYIVFFEEVFMIRFVYRNNDTGQKIIYTIEGFYNLLDNLDLSQIYNESTSLNEEEKATYLDSIADTIIAKGYQSAAKERQFIQLSSNMLSYILLLLIVTLLIKGNFMLNRKKGFKYSQALKVSIISSIQSYLIALVLSFMGFDLVTTFGLALTIRTLYLWFRYTTSKHNTAWLNDLYEFSKSERFLLNTNTNK